MLAAQGRPDEVTLAPGGTAVAEIVPGRGAHEAGQELAPGDLGLEQSLDEARHLAAELAVMQGLLRGAGGALMPLHGQVRLLVGAEGVGLGGGIRFFLGLALPGLGLVTTALFALFGMGLVPLVGLVEILLGQAGLVATPLVVRVIDVPIQGLGVVLFLQQGVNFLRRQALETGIVQGRGGRRQAILDQEGVDGVVAGQVPFASQPVLAAGKVRQGAVQGIVGEHELGLVQTQGGDVVGVVIEGAGIRGGGGTPIRVRGLDGQPQGQGPEKGLVQDQPGAGRGQLDFDGLALRVHDQA